MIEVASRHVYMSWSSCRSLAVASQEMRTGAPKTKRPAAPPEATHSAKGSQATSCETAGEEGGEEEEQTDDPVVEPEPVKPKPDSKKGAQAKKKHSEKSPSSKRPKKGNDSKGRPSVADEAKTEKQRTPKNKSNAEQLSSFSPQPGVVPSSEKAKTEPKPAPKTLQQVKRSVSSEDLEKGQRPVKLPKTTATAAKSKAVPQAPQQNDVSNDPTLDPCQIEEHFSGIFRDCYFGFM